MSVALAAFALVAIAYATYYAVHKWIDKKEVSADPVSTQPLEFAPHGHDPETNAVNRKGNKKEVSPDPSNTFPISELPVEMFRHILTFSDNPAVGGVSHAFMINENAVFNQHIESLNPFRKHYNLPLRKPAETSHSYLLRCISVINKEQNKILGEEFSLAKTSTLHMLEQLNERESIIQDHFLDRFCRAIEEKHPGSLTTISAEEPLVDRAAHWRRELEAKGGTFYQLNLDNAGIKRLPKEIHHFNALTRLSLWNNQLQSLPESFGRLTALTRLLLSGNQLRSLPESFGGLTALTDLYLSGNQLQSLPESFGRLTALTSLDLDNNQLQSLPESFGGLTALTDLYLSGNQLQSLPESFGRLTALTILFLLNNQLQSLPESFGRLTALTRLLLSGNQLQSLPESFGNLNALTSLNLNNNQLQSLPESFGNLNALTILFLLNNQLQSLPESFGNLNALTILDLQKNQFFTLSAIIWNILGQIKTHNTLNQLRSNGCNVRY